MKIVLFAISLVLPLQVYAINPPHWTEFSKGESIDTENVKSDGNIASAYIMLVSGKKKVTTLYEVNCNQDQIRVHSDTPRFIRVPVEGGGTVVQSDDGFRTVAPDSQNARIENAICGFVAQVRAQETKEINDKECQRELTDIKRRVTAFEIDGKLTYEEATCLSGLVDGKSYSECAQAKIPQGTSVVQYLHDKSLYLECENHAAVPLSHNPV